MVHYLLDWWRWASQTPCDGLKWAFVNLWKYSYFKVVSKPGFDFFLALIPPAKHFVLMRYFLGLERTCTFLVITHLKWPLGVQLEQNFGDAPSSFHHIWSMHGQTMSKNKILANSCKKERVHLQNFVLTGRPNGHSQKCIQEQSKKVMNEHLFYKHVGALFYVSQQLKAINWWAKMSPLLDLAFPCYSLLHQQKESLESKQI